MTIFVTFLKSLSFDIGFTQVHLTNPVYHEP